MVKSVIMKDKQSFKTHYVKENQNQSKIGHAN